MDLTRPYLVVPKLIIQPTWGGNYIVKTKNWHDHPEFTDLKIGQAYELFDKSNLSLLSSSSDPAFSGEVSDSKSVEIPASIPNTLPLTDLISEAPDHVLGKSVASRFGPTMHLLIKFTQSLGNSFQIHIKDGITHPKWQTKPESWYYFEPGLITLGVIPDTNWVHYQKAVTEIETEILRLGSLVNAGSLAYDDANKRIGQHIKKYDPWRFVNVVRVAKDELIDVSPCGIHHSWEEDFEKLPLGNVLYEVQLNRMDSISTIRCFDKGKMGNDGTTRPLQIEDYFALIDRSPEANNPQSHIRHPTILTENVIFTHERLLQTNYYTLEKVTYKTMGEFTERIKEFRHAFVKEGIVEVTCGQIAVEVTAGHSVFIPAGAQEYTIKSKQDKSVVLISY